MLEGSRAYAERKTEGVEGMKANEFQNIEYKWNWHGECLKWVCGLVKMKGDII